MTTRNIDDQVRQYYGGVAFAPASLDRLRGVLTRAASGRAGVEKPSRSMSAWQIVALAASISIVFLSGAILMLRRPPVDAGPVAGIGLSERLAGEVARRHVKCIEEIPFQAEDLGRLIARMDKVDFAAGVPSRRGIHEMKLKGAHYCVLDGQIAIHAVLVDESGEIVSLFETKAGANIASLRSATHRMGRTEVELWQENGVLYAAAFPAPTT